MLRSRSKKKIKKEAKKFKMDYIVTRSDSNDELMHYGVKGMKWGVRRASRALSKATTSKQRDKAVASLEKHRAKATKEIGKLNKRNTSLNKRIERHKDVGASKAAKWEAQAVKLDSKAAHKERKAYRMFATENSKARNLSKAAKLKSKANVLHTRASTLTANYERNKAYVERNERTKAAFQKGINDIDQALIERGKRYLAS